MDFTRLLSPSLFLLACYRFLNADAAGHIFITIHNTLLCRSAASGFYLLVLLLFPQRPQLGCHDLGQGAVTTSAPCCSPGTPRRAVRGKSKCTYGVGVGSREEGAGCVREQERSPHTWATGRTARGGGFNGCTVGRSAMCYVSRRDNVVIR